MKRVVPLGAFAACLAACAQVLSYDDYTARVADAGTAPVDASVTETDTAIAADTGDGPAQLPARPPGATTPSGKGKTLWVAAKRMYLGSMTSLGMTSVDAWKEWGFDLDKICTSQSDSVMNIGTCRRHAEAKQDFLVDGDACRDNNFGHHIIALLSVSSEGFEKRINEGILEGSTTWVIRINDLDDGADDPYAPAMLYRADSAKGLALKWDGTDVRKILNDSVTGNDLEKPITEFKKGYVKGNVWVSGEPELRQLVLPVSGSLYVPLELESAAFTVALNADHKSGTRGTVGGAIPVAAIETLMRPIATESGFCPGTTLYNSLLRTVQRFPDVVIGAPGLQDTTRECDGISIGIAFDVSPIQPVTELVPPPPPPKDACGDAGVDGG